MLKRLSVVSALVLSALAVAASVRQPPLLLISIDGLRADDLVTAADRGRLPNLARLMREGVHGRLLTVEPSVTYPAHATLVTGTSPARHGILQNKPFDPLGRNADGWYWYAEDIRVPTLWDAARRGGITTSSIDWPVTVGARIDYNIAQYWRNGEAHSPDAVKVLRALSTKGLLEEEEQELGAYPSSNACDVGDDERRVAFAVRLIVTKRPGLHLSYLCSLDAVRHAGDPLRPEVQGVLSRLDAAVGSLRAAAVRSSGGQAQVAVVSDHGFTRTTRELDLNAALARAGLLQLDASARTRGWRAVAWGHGGSAVIVLRDPGDQTARSSVRELLRRLSDCDDAPVERFAEISATSSGTPDPAFRVFFRLDTRLVDNRSGVVDSVGAETLGDHGHDPVHREMDAAFVLAGPDVPSNRDLGRLDMRSVAPTLAGLLHVELPQAEASSVLTGPVLAARR